LVRAPTIYEHITISELATPAPSCGWPVLIQGSAVSLADRSVGLAALVAARRERSTPTAIATATTTMVISNA
jgi:hypothetical protein